MAVCYGFLMALVVSACDQGFPPVVRSMADRAAINFAHECKRVLHIACPDAAAYIHPSGRRVVPLVSPREDGSVSRRDL